VLRFAYWIVLTASALLLFISLWIVIPTPHPYLLPFGVGSPELSPVLLAAALVLGLLGSLKARRMRSARLAVAFAVAAAILAFLVIVQLPSTLKQFDEAMLQTSSNGKNMRPRPVVLRDLFRRFDAGPAQATHRVEFAKTDGISLTLDVYHPLTPGKFPVVIRLYGGSWQRGSPPDEEWVARYFASRGYVVFVISYRHAPQWKWPEQLEDVRSAIVWVSEHAAEFDGDATRIVLFGRSSGGHLALRVAYQEAPSSIRGVVSYYGPIDLAEAWRHPPQPDPLGVRDILEAFLGGTPEEMAGRYQHASPISYVSNRVPPTLLVYGGRDHIVEARFSENLDQALKKSGNTSVLLQLPWSEHAFDVLPNGLGGQISLYYTERFIAWAVSR
jgi:acetyl esterase/lipase